MDQPKLKLGFLLNLYFVPAWTFLALERIINSNAVEIALVILLEKPFSGKQGGKGSRNRDQIIPRLYNALDEKLFVRGLSATELKNAEKLFLETNTLKIKPERTDDGGFLEPADVEKLRSHDLDILVNIGFEHLQGDIFQTSKNGVWEYYCEQEPYGYWEVLKGITETRMSLRVMTAANPEGEIIYSSSSWTYPFSPARNRNHSLWKAASFLPRQIESFYRLGKEAFFQQAREYSSDFHIQKRPSIYSAAWTQLWLLLKLLFKNVSEMISRRIKLDAWFLMIDLHEEGMVPFRDYEKIIPPKYVFWADPHVIQKGNDHFIFVEEYDARKRKGHISVLKIDPAGNIALPVKVLEQPYHLSYPCVFEWEDHYYMVPESSENRTIDLYECTEFPNQWTHKVTLMENVNAVDNTLFFHNGKWWMFTGISENEGSSPEVELFLFFKEDLFSGEWKSHPLNPLKSDAKNARPAGAILKKDGKLFRPSQDCSKYYGYGFDLNEILLLSETEYKDECVTSVRPGWDRNVLATHTYGVDGTLKVIDAYTTKFRFQRN